MSVCQLPKILNRTTRRWGVQAEMGCKATVMSSTLTETSMSAGAYAVLLLFSASSDKCVTPC